MRSDWQMNNNPLGLSTKLKIYFYFIHNLLNLSKCVLELLGDMCLSTVVVISGLMHPASHAILTEPADALSCFQIR